jgi:hypothetical protein
MDGFKLIAIVPLKGCSPKYRKNLSIGPYQIYADYQIDFTKKDNVKIVTRKPQTIPEDFYALDNGIKVNVSAIVGKNGSGKSAISELLFYLIYLISSEKKNSVKRLIPFSEKLQLKIKELEQERTNLKKIIGRRKDNLNYKEIEGIGFTTFTNYLIEVMKKHKLSFNFPKNNSDYEIAQKAFLEIRFQINRTKFLLKEELNKELSLKKKLNLSVIYEIDKNIYELEWFNQKFTCYKHGVNKIIHSNNLEEFELTDFFYTIAINYSHHALNSQTIGHWIEGLFHKNDAYVAPASINPMRTQGNFDINREVDLLKERLMANLVFRLLENPDYKLLDKYKVKNFVFTLKEAVSKPMEYGKLDEDVLMNKLLIKKVGISEINENIDYWDFALRYLEKKLERTEDNYDFLIYSEQSEENEPLLGFILKDESHVNKKIRQTLNFLMSTYKEENRKFWKMPQHLTQIKFSWDSLSSWLKTFGQPIDTLKPSDLIEYALPGFFKVDFELETGNGEEILFGNLSSGEQQKILNINAIIYHLYNIQSIHKNVKTSKEADNRAIQRVSYKHININLDEIEMYYHPEQQRELIDVLLEELENVKAPDEKGIESINICFLTHSPFILSDIPVENILHLNYNSKKGVAEQVTIDGQTFGANIHDLLAHSFFLEDTLMGKFADKKISELILDIKKGKVSLNDSKLVDLVGDTYLKSMIKQFKHQIDKDIN